MNRVLHALKNNRCVIAVNSELLSRNEIEKSLRATKAPTVALGDPIAPAVAIDDESLSTAFTPNGVLALVEPDFNAESTKEIAKKIKAASQKPQLIVISKAFNRFALPLSLRLMKIQHIKMRGDQFIAALEPEETQEPEKVKKEILKPKAPSSDFIGRESELAALEKLLQDDGRPIVISGPAGIGKRWLCEQALSSSNLTRLPDLHLDGLAYTDAFLGKVALTAAKAGNSKLKEALRARGKRPRPGKVAELVKDALQTEGLNQQVWVVSGFEKVLDKRDNSYYQEGALELALQALFQTDLKLKLIFLSERNIQTYHAENKSRNIELTGFTDEEAKSYLKAWRLTEDQVNECDALLERSKGHPLALQSLAISIQGGMSAEELSESNRGTIEDIYDSSKVRKHIRRQFDKLDKDLKEALNAIAMYRSPSQAEYLQFIKVNRNKRMQLLAKGLLAQTPQSSDRRYYVHALTKSLFRRGPDFEQMHMVGLELQNLAKRAKKDEQDLMELHLIQEANILLTVARKRNECWRTSVPFVDPICNSVRELIFHRKKPDVAQRIINIGFQQAPNHPDLLLLDVINKKKTADKKTDRQKMFDALHSKGGTPESYHLEASHHLDRKALNKGVKTLRSGIKAFPYNGRLHRRLASILIRSAEYNGAVETLINAAEGQPLMPDNFGLMGAALTQLGEAHWEKAAAAFERSKTLDAQNPNLFVYEARLIRAQGMKDLQQNADQIEEAKKLLQAALDKEPTHFAAREALAELILDTDGDIDKADGLLTDSLKRRDRPQAHIQKARIQIRKKAFDQVESHLDRAYKLANNNHAAFGVRGEFYFALGDVFRALEAFKTALERCPESSPERHIYQTNVDKMKAIIESGNANAMMDAIKERREIIAKGEGFRREAGSIIRRKKSGEEEIDHNDEEATPAENDVEHKDEEASVDSGEDSNPTEAQSDEEND